MNEKNEIESIIAAYVNQARLTKGLEEIGISADTILLGGDIGIDSLDLAVIVTKLEAATQKDPFKDGFVEFKSVGELVDLYS